MDDDDDDDDDNDDDDEDDENNKSVLRKFHTMLKWCDNIKNGINK